MTYADLRAVDFFKRQGFVELEPSDINLDQVPITKCTRSKLMVLYSDYKEMTSSWSPK
jgi:hypothetical protein